MRLRPGSLDTTPPEEAADFLPFARGAPGRARPGLGIAPDGFDPAGCAADPEASLRPFFARAPARETLAPGFFAPAPLPEPPVPVAAASPVEPCLRPLPMLLNRPMTGCRRISTCHSYPPAPRGDTSRPASLQSTSRSRSAGPTFAGRPFQVQRRRHAPVLLSCARMGSLPVSSRRKVPDDHIHERCPAA